ncbi:zinc finger protein 608-like [Gouania willdenowi]|uniref:zinc finger protein 608-like n=1 Tax=Gouania willdenowi TaxID=441366 RepID=UPI0010565C24|nr:zinc finger protein 608-like [Gouania willdenowi]
MYSEHRIDLKKISEQKLLQKERSFQMSGSKKVDFKVPAPSPPGHHGEPGTSAFPSSCPSAQLTSSQKQLDGGPSGPLDGNSSFLGPCQPRTRVNLKGVVCCETEGGILMVDIKWRNRSYVGTLLDSTQHDWVPKSFSEWQSKNPELRGGCEPEKRKRTTDGDE